MNNSQTFPTTEDRLKGPGAYGQFYWCIKVTLALTKAKEIYINADRIDVGSAGELICLGGYRSSYKEPPLALTRLLVIAPGQWTAYFAASGIDGSAVAVDHWDGEVVR